MAGIRSDDYDVFQRCLAGPETPPSGNCPQGVNADLDDDNDVDLADFRVFQLSFTGP